MNATSKRILKWAGVAAGALVLVGTGAAAGQDPTSSTEYLQLADQRDELTNERDGLDEELAETQQALDDAEAEIISIQGKLPQREEAVEAAEQKLKKREAKVEQADKAVGAAENAVTKRERAVGIIEAEIRANTITDGIYQVGTDIKAGTYKTQGSSGCYYAVLGSANTSDIVNNSIGDGPSILSVSEGQFLELSCSGAEWVLQP